MHKSLLLRCSLLLSAVAGLATACKKAEPSAPISHNYPESIYFRVFYTDRTTGGDWLKTNLPDTVRFERRSSTEPTANHLHARVYTDSTGRTCFGLVAGTLIPPCYVSGYTPPKASFRDTFFISLRADVTDTLFVEQNPQWPETLFDYRGDQAYRFPVELSAYGRVRLHILR